MFPIVLLRSKSFFQLTTKAPEVFPVIGVVGFGCVLATVMGYRACTIPNNVRFDIKKRRDLYYHMKHETSKIN